jgi:hypothetical protein
MTTFRETNNVTSSPYAYNSSLTYRYCPYLQSIVKKVVQIVQSIFTSLGNLFSQIKNRVSKICNSSKTPVKIEIPQVKTGPQTPLLNFYRGGAVGVNNLTLDQLLKKPDDQLTAVRGYSAWLFPLQTPSPNAPEAPVLDANAIKAFQTEEVIKKNFMRAFSRMLTWYGFMYDGTEYGQVLRADNFADRKKHWLTENNLHFKTITRILHSLKILGMEQQARAFKSALDEVYLENTAFIPAQIHNNWSAPFVTAPKARVGEGIKKESLKN